MADGCNPPQCLEIPPALPPPSPTADDICGFTLDWYRSWPIIFGVNGTGLDATQLSQVLNSIANAGGRLLDINLFFKDADGNCTIEVSILYPNPGPGSPSQYQVQCPPGWTWDSQLEECVAPLPIIIPPPPGFGNGGGGGGGGGTGKCDPLVDPEACCPAPSHESKPCVVLCLYAGVLSLKQCLIACCVPPPDPPLTDTITEMFAGRPASPKGLPRPARAARAFGNPVSAGPYLELMRPRNGPPIRGFG